MTRLAPVRNRLLAAATALAIGIGLPLVVAAPAGAGVDDFSFESMAVDYTLGRDDGGYSTLQVVENLVALFPDYDQNRGIVRSIPWKYGDVNTELSVNSVTDENGNPVPYWTEDDGDFVDVLTGNDDFVHGRTTYVISYTMAHVIRPFADSLKPHQEFYWDVNGTGWGQSFGTVSATVHLTDGTEADLNGDVACYQGYDGDSIPCTSLEPVESGFHFTAENLAPYQTLTFAIGFVDGSFHSEPTPRDNPIVAVFPWLLLGLLGLVLIAVIWLRVFFWRHAPGRGIVIAQYEAPEGVGVMQSAHMVDRGQTALPAEIVNLTVLRAASLIEDPQQSLDHRYKLVLLDPSLIVEKDDDSASRTLFMATAPGTPLQLDRSNQKLGDRITSLVAQTRVDIRTRGFLVRRKSRLASFARFLAFWIGVAAVFIGFWASDNNGGSPLLTLQIFVLIAVGLLCFGFAGAPERRSQKGSELLEHLQGIRLYLTVAEADRIKMLQSPTGAERTRVDPNDNAAVVKLYERLLPFAIIWGVEDEWTKVLGARYATTPTTDGTLANVAAISNFGTFSNSFGASSFATTPPPPSSSGSSFSGGSGGGGSSGGGGGGGGGGGR